MTSIARVSLIVLAKLPVAGRVKTRLCPPLNHEEAAMLARAGLSDTLKTVSEAPVARRVLATDNEPGAWLWPGFDLVRQRGDGLDERIAAAFDDVGGPALLIGSDTPQLSPNLLAFASRTLTSPGVDAVLGPAFDGGWWVAGLRRPAPKAFLGVPMSTVSTGARQIERFRALGLSVVTLPTLRDVDYIEDARAVAFEAPRSAFARTLRGLVEGDGAVNGAKGRFLARR